MVFVNVESKAKVDKCIILVFSKLIIIYHYQVLYELAFVFGNLKENYALFSTVPRKMITIDSSEYISDLIKEGHIAIEVGQQYYDPLTDFVPNQIFFKLYFCDSIISSSYDIASNVWQLWRK